MLLTIVALIIVLFLGYKISHFFIGDKIQKIEFLPVSLITGLTLMGYFVLVLALLFKDLRIAVYSFLIAGGLLSLFLILRSKKINKESINLKTYLNKIRRLPWIEIIFVLIIILLYLNLAIKTLVYENGSYMVAAAGYGDIPFHMNQVSYFINHEPFELQEIIYLGNKLTYPFLINFLSSSFFILNQNYILSFHLPSFLLAVSGIILLYLLIRRIIKKPLIRICAFLIFFFGASLGFLRIINDPLLKTQGSFGDLINYLLHLPYPIVTFYDAVYPGQNIIWASVFTMFLLHQRTFFFGFALGILAVFLIFLAWQNKDKKLFYFTGLLIGLLPLVHIHSFIALGIVLVGFFLASLLKDYTLARRFFYSGVLSVIIAILPFYILSFNPLNPGEGAGFLKFRLGWMTERNGIGAIQYNPSTTFHVQEWLSFLWQNFGFFIPILIIAVIVLLFKKSFQKKEIILPMLISALLIFTAVNLIRFQLWDYDNNKVLAFFFLLGSLIIGYFWDNLKSKIASAILVVFTFIIIITGVIDALSRSSFANPLLYDIFKQNEIKTAKWIKENIDSSQIILTSSHHLNLVSSLAGKPVLLGYPGWLWSHGINYYQRESEANRIFLGTNDAKDLLKKYNISYVMIGPREKYEHKANEQFFNQTYPLVFEIEDIKIYKITTN